MIHNYYQIGGGEHTVFENEVKMLKDYGENVLIYTRNNDELKKNRLKVFFLPFSTTWSWKTYWDVKKLIRKYKIDIVHCHNTFPLISPSVYYAAIKMKIPVVQTIHNFRFLCPNGSFFCNEKICEKCNEKNSFKDAIDNKCYRNSKLGTKIVVRMLKHHRKIGTYRKISYIFLTDFSKEKFGNLIDINSDQVFVKPNFVVHKNDVDRIVDKVKKVFVYAGRLEDNKGVRILINYWSKLPNDYVLHIYGDGNLRDFVVKNSKGNIIYFGFCSQEKVFKDLSSSMGLVFPSIWYEGFPMIICESMSLGCPILSTNIGNAGDLIQKSCPGATFDPHDEKTFLNAIHDIVEHNESYSANARLYYLQELTEADNYKKLKEIYAKARTI